MALNIYKKLSAHSPFATTAHVAYATLMGDNLLEKNNGKNYIKCPGCPCIFMTTRHTTTCDASAAEDMKINGDMTHKMDQYDDDSNTPEGETKSNSSSVDWRPSAQGTGWWTFAEKIPTAHKRNTNARGRWN